MSSQDQELAKAHEPFEAAIVELANHAPGSESPVAATHHTLRERLTGLTQRFAVRENLGNNVAITRGDNPKTMFESIPFAVRIGMHLLYAGREQEKLLGLKRVDAMLKEQSINTGRKYDMTGPSALAHIKDFIKTYDINTEELLEQDLNSYPTFNSFFARKLRAGARPIDQPDNKAVLSSAADSRLVVFESVDLAKQFWIKGEQFTIAHLFDDVEMAKPFDGCSIAIFRLAPADYHRSHSPVDGTIGRTKEIEGTLFTVNPVAIRENLDVFTRNRRDVTIISTNLPSGGTVDCAFVAVGAMLVGSIFHSVKEGDVVKRGDELSGYQYGGSTSILLLPKSANIRFDEDLLVNSKNGLETAVKVGNHIGTFL